jgi:hypothetical protein
MKPKTFTDTPGWEFHIDEVSANVFVVRASDGAGRTIEKTGIDPDALLEECRQEVKQTSTTIRRSMS